MQEKFADCLQSCNDCAAQCYHCVAACLQEDDVKMMARCIALDIDCAQACGEECENHETDHCQQCAGACFDCAEQCRSMATA